VANTQVLSETGATAEFLYGARSTYPVSVSDPATFAGGGHVYTKTVAARAELFYRDSTGAVVQITSGGAVAGTSGTANRVAVFDGAGALSSSARFQQDGSTDIVTVVDGTGNLGSTTNRLSQGFLSTSVSIGTNPATAGAVRLANNTSIQWRNAGNTLNHDVILLDAAGNFLLGNAVTNSFIYLGAGNFANFLSTGIQPSVDASVALGATATRWTNGVFSALVSVGTNPATAGAVRLANNTSVQWRNAANSANFDVLTVNASNNLSVGAGIAGTITVGSASLTNLTLNVSVAGGAMHFQVAGTDQWFLDATTLRPNGDNTEELGSTASRIANVVVGTSVQIGTNPSATGAVRLANGTSINFRNAANSADSAGLQRLVTDEIVVGGIGALLLESSTAAWNFTLGAAAVATLTSAAGFSPGVLTVKDFGSAGSEWRDCYLSSSVRVGTNPSATGGVRLANAIAVKSRNAANSGDVNVITLNATDDIVLGENTAGVSVILDIPDNGFRINNQATNAGASTGTLTNAPSAGNPAFWLPIDIAGTVRSIPCWA